MQGTRAYGARITATIATLAVATLLAACGGGGGSSAPTVVTPPVVVPPVVVVTPPTIMLQSITPASGAVNVPTTYSVDFKFAHTNASSFTADFKSTCNGVPVTESTIGVAVIETIGNLSTATIKVTVTGMPNNAACKIEAKEVTATGSGGSVSIGASTAFTTIAATPATWYQTIITKLVQVFGANRLPETCFLETDPCWVNLLANGTVKVVETPALMTGAVGSGNGRDTATRPVVAAYYRSAKGLWNISIVYRDTGKLISGGITGGIVNEIDWVVGIDEGFLVHEKETDSCFKLMWHPPTTVAGVRSNVWAFTPASCTLPQQL